MLNHFFRVVAGLGPGEPSTSFLFLADGLQERRGCPQQSPDQVRGRARRWRGDFDLIGTRDRVGSVTQWPPYSPNVGLELRTRGGEMKFTAVVGTAMIALLAVSSKGMAQHKTTSDCQKEWQASRAANLVRGMTERAYVDQCRAGGSSAARAASFAASSPAGTTPSVPSSPPPAATPADLSTRPANKILCE